jgi:8-oxo-dGTP diphosphatase
MEQAADIVLPRTGVSVAVFRGGEVLLALRGKEPYGGFWSLPGGSQHAGETLGQAARRELREETGLELDNLAFVEFFEPIRRDTAGRVTAHFVLAVHAATAPPHSSAVAGDDAAALCWRAIDDLGGLKMTPGAADVIARAYRGIAGK